MSSALDASGGPQVQVGTEGTSTSVSWPNARYDITNGMGSYVWRCEKEAEPTGR